MKKVRIRLLFFFFGLRIYSKCIFFILPTRDLTEKIYNGEYYPLFGDFKSPIGENIYKWGLGINLSGNAESENKSPIANWVSHILN